MKHFRTLVVALFFVITAHAQSGKASDKPSGDDRMTNTEVVAMVRAGISPEVILAKIRLSRCNFDTGATVLAELKQGGVPDDILLAMIEAPRGRPQAVKPPAPERADEAAPGAEDGRAASADKVDGAKPKELAAAGKIVSALRRLDNAIAVGVTFQNYSALLIEHKTVVDENLKDVTDSAFTRAVERMMVDHQYAMWVWNLAVANGWSYFYSKQEPGRTLITRYGVPIKISIWTQVPVMTGLNHVWLSARGHFNQADNIYRQMGEKQ